MKTFEIREEFYLDGKPFKILSGAIQYFRLHPTQWRETLHNLKALGYNTVETYVPWSVHEVEEGQFDFNDMKDIEAYIQLVQEMGLYMIVRPAPYMCAEWDFGGLPAWLLKYPNMRYRTNDVLFLEKVSRYYDGILTKLLPYQITNGGPILMMQVENEYGSYCNDKEYMRALVKMMRDKGVTVPLFTSDGAWEEALDAGSLIEDGIFVTGNFGSASKENADNLKIFIQKHNKNWPIMCTEYWDGWFTRWQEPVVRRDGEDLAQCVKEMMQIGSLNLFLLRGGTNYGFISGCSARKTADLPQVTSYDFDCPITEWGTPTSKYYAVQRVTKELFPEIEQMEPIVRQAKAYGSFPIKGVADLMSVIDEIAVAVPVDYPKPMEQLNQYYGYTFYRTQVKNFGREERVKVIDTHDRAHFYVDGVHKATQYKEQLGDEVFFEGQPDKELVDIDILVENMGRVNYGFKLNAPSQSKGIKGGVMVNIHFHKGWSQYSLPFDKVMMAKLQCNKEVPETVNKPMFYAFDVNLSEDELKDTFIDCSEFGKGCVFVNGFNLGRYWSKGPMLYLYVPAGLLKEKNEFIVFETENKIIKDIVFVDKPIFKDMEDTERVW